LTVDSFFFFSSRRRHTRSYGDWSSDVCSSDLWRRYSFGKITGPLSVARTAVSPFFGSRRLKSNGPMVLLRNFQSGVLFARAVFAKVRIALISSLVIEV